jgi:hypothetical protein
MSDEATGQTFSQRFSNRNAMALNKRILSTKGTGARWLSVLESESAAAAHKYVSHWASQFQVLEDSARLLKHAMRAYSNPNCIAHERKQRDRTS